jgi:S1-C subfamily serine protease
MRFKNLLFLLLCLGVLVYAFPASAIETLKGSIMEQSEIAPPPPPKPQHGIVGISFLIYPQDNPLIQEVFPNTPAARAGLRAGDRVVAINRQSTQGLSKEAVDEAISDVPGAKVNFMVNRQGKIFSVTLTVESLDALHSQKMNALYETLFGQ